MSIRPDGLELLQLARVVIDAAIVPHVPDERRDAVNAIKDVIALAEDRLARDVEASAMDLAALEDARAVMHGAILEALPDEQRYDARLVAKAMAVATRQLASAGAAERCEYERLLALLGEPADDDASLHAIRCRLPSLNERLGARIRAGQTDAGTAYAMTLAHLEAATLEALSKSNPTYRRRAPDATPSNAGAKPGMPLPLVPLVAALNAWREVPRAFLRAVPVDVSPAPLGPRIDAWLNFRGVAADALCASGNVAFATQADLIGWFTQRLAANPRVPMVAVEGAHQAHDLAVAVAETTSAFFKFAFAPFRYVQPRPVDATRLP